MENQINSIERDKFLTEVMGECWHESTIREYELEIEGCTGCFIEKRCSCGRIQRIGKKYTDSDTTPLCTNKSFSSWDGFGKLWEWMMKQEWSNEFLKKITVRKLEDYGVLHQGVHLDYINPDRFADAVYSFIKQK